MVNSRASRRKGSEVRARHATEYSSCSTLGNDRGEEGRQGGRGTARVVVVCSIHRRNKENDDLTDDIAYEDEGNEYEMNFNNSDDSFGMDNGDDDDGPTY